jgi:hypothetical protein
LTHAIHQSLDSKLTYAWVCCSSLPSWTLGHTPVLLALPPALSRVSRQPLALLDDVLDATASLTNNAFSGFATQLVYNHGRVVANLPHTAQGGFTAAYALEALKSLVHKLAAAVRQWPTETSAAGLLKIHSSLLRTLDAMTLTMPLPYDQSSNIARMPAPLLDRLNPANAYCQIKCKHAAQCMVSMTSALLSTGFNFWQGIGYEEEFQEEGLLSQLNRGRALAAHCLLWEKGFQSCTIAGQLSGTAFLEGVSQLTRVLLKAAETYQVSLECIRPLAAGDACTSISCHGPTSAYLTKNTVVWAGQPCTAFQESPMM